jgi:hypothetical protein
MHHIVGLVRRGFTVLKLFLTFKQQSFDLLGNSFLHIFWA